jgi:hypothetical protein
MATTETKRKWFPEHVTNHADRGTAGFKPKCNWSGAALIAVPNNLDGVYIEPVHPKTAEAWDAYVFLMRHFKQSITNAGGVNSCRNIGSSVWPSLHAYLLAIDNPPNSRKSAEFQAAVLKVKTNNGKKVFKNLASIDDRMHDEIDCSPADLATGIDWSTVEGWKDDEVTTEELIKEIQTAINQTGVTPPLAINGVWDIKTRNRFVAAMMTGGGTPGPEGPPGPAGPAGKDGGNVTLTIKGDAELG